MIPAGHDRTEDGDDMRDRDDLNDHDDAFDQDDPALDPRDMLALVDDQQRSIAGRVGAFVPYVLLVWGLAWLLGFGALWLAYADDPVLPVSVAAPIVIGLFLTAGALSAVLALRSARGVRGAPKDKTFSGVVYGQAWWVGALAIFAIGQALTVAGMDRELLDLLYPAMYMFFAGVMFAMAAIIWRAVPMLVLGGWAVLLSAAAAFAGTGGQYLVHALGGGGMLLALGVWTWAWGRRARRRVSAGPAA
ncbi:hypothetical protein [Microbacterium soli]|uniref:Transporter n=1 Tax=Microbacterium soli TaxID=446075 RepID=A0ABP7ND43_9MICO